MQRQHSIRALSIVLAALAALGLALVNWRHPVLRLTSAYANVATLWLMLLLPWAATIVALTLLRRWVRWLMLALAACAIVYTAMDLSFVSLGLLSTPYWKARSWFHAAPPAPLPRGGSLVVYLDDCAPRPFGVVVRQERVLVPGLLLVRDVYAYGGIEDASIEITSPDRALVDGQEVHLRPWVYW